MRAEERELDRRRLVVVPVEGSGGDWWEQRGLWEQRSGRGQGDEAEERETREGERELLYEIRSA